MMLITIAVVTYNSSKTVLETLDSVKQQTYAEIELIVSDDCSTDNTLEIVSDWTAKNKDRFVRIRLLSSDENRGIVPNRNKCIREAQGEWIKFADGDDMLTPNSIQSYLSVMSDEANFIMGNVITMYETGEKTKFTVKQDFFKLNAPEQLALYRKNTQIDWPGVIFRTKALLDLNGLDERFPMFDDIPFFFKAFKAGYKFDCVDETVVIYRIHKGSVQHSEKFHISHANYLNQIIAPEYLEKKKYLYYWHEKLWSERRMAQFNNQPAKVFFIYLLMLISDPKEWYYIMRDKIYRPVVLMWKK